MFHPICQVAASVGRQTTLCSRSPGGATGAKSAVFDCIQFDTVGRVLNGIWLVKIMVPLTPKRSLQKEVGEKPKGNWEKPRGNCLTQVHVKTAVN